MPMGCGFAGSIRSGLFDFGTPAPPRVCDLTRISVAGFCYPRGGGG